MKKSLLIFLTIFVSNGLWAQDETTRLPLKVEAGFMYLNNMLNQDNYYAFISSAGLPDGTVMGGLSLKLSAPTKYENLDLLAGTIFMLGMDKLGSSSFSSPASQASDYLLNGGGVYAGISPHTTGKYIGLYIDLGIGIFSFKEYTAYVDTRATTVPAVYYYDKKASGGPGAISSAGLRLSAGRFGFNPCITAVYCGGSNGGFMFYGFTAPLSIQF